ncbi:MAG TPA: CDP-alcohol phosphatidyltransferase family protein, partial [Tepidisphaeraceae bacterium]|nr:CDP-alcohol phosphatidyltransferase family protein [Tepidisphaeraceae bacterium]
MDESIKQKIPNAITLARLCLAVVLFGLLHIYQYSDLRLPMWYLDACCALFLIASLTDFVDGYLARKWKVESVFGRMVDPFVDKILVLGTFAYLAGPKLGLITEVSATVVVLLLGRELLVTALRAKSEGGGQS